jgi:hypothetical protein
MMRIQNAAPLIACRIVEELISLSAETGQRLPFNLEEASEQWDINTFGINFAADLLKIDPNDIASMSDYLESAQAIVNAFLEYR